MKHHAKVQNNKIEFKSDFQEAMFYEKMNGKNIVIEAERDDTRTLSQNSSLHLYCTQLSNMFNDSGLDMKVVLKPSIDIEWTKDTVRKYIWKPVQKYLFQTESTTILKRVDEINKIHEHINRFLAKNPATQNLPYLPFPNEDNKLSTT